MKTTRVLTLLIGVLACSPHAFGITTYVLATGENVNSPFPASSGIDGNTGALSLGSLILNLADATGSAVNGAVLTGSSTLFCVSSAATPANCAASANSNAPSVNGHAAGIGVGDGRLDGSETITISVLAGYTASLVGFQVTGFYDETGEQMAYSIDGGPPAILNATSAAIDTFDFSASSLAFTTLTFSVPAQGGSVANTYALYSLTLDIVADEPSGPDVPEPSTGALLALGLAGIGVGAIRRRRKKP